MSKTGKIDLTLLKKFVSELELNLAVADGIRVAEKNPHDYLVELSKAAGLAISVSQEATMLMGDISKLMMQIQNPSSSKGDLLEKLLSGVSGAGGNGPSGGSGFGGGFGGGNHN